MSQDKIQKPATDKGLESWEIQPHGMFVIFSQETISLPAKICGYAMPKTALCQAGILVLNTGIIDPEYHGLISGTAINFRKTPYVIKKGEPFLRLVFEWVEPEANIEPVAIVPQQLPQKEIENYRNKILLAAHSYPETFLSIRERTQQISAQVIQSMLKAERRTWAAVLAAVALLIGSFEAISFIIPKYYLTEEKIKQISVDELKAQEFERRSFEEILNKRLQQIDGNIKKLTEEVQNMKARK